MGASLPSDRHEFDAQALLAEAGWVQSLARRLTSDDQTAGDVAQNALTLAMEKRPATRAGLRPWLASVVSTLAMHERRGAGRRRLHESQSHAQRPVDAPGADELVMRVEAQQRVATAVCSLPEPYRSVLLRRYYDGQSCEVIAAAHGQAPSTVRSQLTRGIQRLRAQFAEPGADRGHVPAVLLAAAGLRQPAPASPVIAGPKFAAWPLLAVPAAAALVLIPVWRAGLPEAVEPQPEETVELAALAPEAIDRQQPSRSAVQQAVDPQQDPGLTPLITASGTGARLRIVTKDGRPIAGARLAWSPLGDGPDVVALADEGGFALLVLPADGFGAELAWGGRLRLRAEAPGYAQQVIEWRPKGGSITAIGHVELKTGGALRGRVVDADGQPVSGAWIVSAVGSERSLTRDRWRRGPLPNRRRVRVRADAEGRFVCAGLEPGNRQLWIRGAASHWSLTDAHELEAGQQVNLGTLEALPAPDTDVITGTVLRGGLPVEGAVVGIGANQDGISPGTQTVTGTDGVFRYALPQSRSVVVIAGLAGDVPMTSGARAVRPGETVVLELTPAERVDLTAVDPSGKPLPGVGIGVQAAEQALLQATGSGPYFLPNNGGAWTDERGMASLFLPPNRVRLVGAGDDYRTAEPLVIGLPRPASLMLRLEEKVQAVKAAPDAPELAESHVPVRLSARFFVDDEPAVGWRGELRPRGPLLGEPVGQGAQADERGELVLAGLPGDYDVLLVGELEGRRLTMSREIQLYSSRSASHRLRTQTLRWAVDAPIANARLVRGDLRNGYSETLELGTVHVGVQEVRAPVGMNVLQAAQPGGTWRFVGILDVVND